jgi:hypothetical protein
MDIALFFAVLRRFKWIVLGGLVLAIALAALSYGRGSVTYESQGEALITQQSFPYGRAAAPTSANGTTSVQIGNSAVLAGLSPVYAQLANSDQIQKAVLKQARAPGTITASQVSDLASGANLPFVQLVATAPTAAAAVTLTQTEFNVLSHYVTQQQIGAGISPADRVQLVLIQTGNPPKLAGGHSSSIPMLVFVAVLGAAIAIAFLREKADPQTAAKLGRIPSGQPQFAHTEPHLALAQDLRHSNGVTATGNVHGELTGHVMSGAAGRAPHSSQHRTTPGGPNVVTASATRLHASRSVMERLIRPPRPDSSAAPNSDV